jgi:glutathione S-transferase
MLDLYFWTTPNGYKVTILLEELGFDYNVVPVHIGKGEQFRPDFLKISPNNKIPVLVDHGGADGKPFALFESGAIMMYLAEKAGWQFMPSDLRQRYEVVQWLMFQMGGIGPMLGQAHHFRRYAKEKIRHRALYQRSDTALSRPREAAQRSRISGRELFDRRHGGLSLVATAQMAGPGYHGVAEPAALVQRRARAARRAAWARSHGGSTRQEAGKAVRRILGRSIRPKTIRGALIASDRSCNSNCRC